MAYCGRSLDSPCTLALLIGFQFAFVLYFSLGGFRGLVSVLVHTTEPEFDYSRPHDVYTNLSHLGVPPLPPRNSGTGPPATGPPLRDCQIPSPLLGEREGWQINVCECSTQWNAKWLLLFSLYSWADRNEARNILSPFLWPVGPVSVHLSSPLSLEEIRQRNPLVLPGGRYRPPDCEPRHHTAIVVPYRNRQSHLRALLYHLHPFLQRQQIHYSIYIVQQVRLCISECASCFIVIPPVSCSAWLPAAACLPSMSKSKALCSGIVVLVDQRCYWVKRLPDDVKGVTVIVVYVLLQSIGLVILEYWAMV